MCAANLDRRDLIPAPPVLNALNTNYRANRSIRAEILTNQRHQLSAAPCHHL